MRKLMEIYLACFLMVSVSGTGTTDDCQTAASQPGNNGTTTTDYIYLQAPSNVTVALLGTTDVVVFWYPPQNQKVTHDFIASDVTTEAPDLDNVEKVNVTVFSVTGSITNTNGSVEYGAPNDTLKESEASNSTLMHVPTGTPVQVPESVNNTQSVRWVKPPCDKILHYLVFYQEKNQSGTLVELISPSNLTEIHLSRLTPGTQYKLSVQAVYNGGVKVRSNWTEFITKGYGRDRKCNCNLHGRDPNDQECDPNRFNWCKCRKGYTGLFCEMCKPGYYRVSPSFPCHRCPCAKLQSSGSCQFVVGQVKCTFCYTGYTGNLCHRCAHGYYAVNGRCERCQCNGNEDIKKLPMCSPATGQCLGCLHNTSGFFCNICAKGYTGDPIKAKNCTLISELQAARASSPGVGIIAAVCVVIILSLSALAGLIVYRKWNNFPSMKRFWTVELQDNHESVSFSGVPADDRNGIASDAKTFDDMAFYERQASREARRGKDSSYAPLREDI